MRQEFLKGFLSNLIHNKFFEKQVFYLKAKLQETADYSEISCQGVISSQLGLYKLRIVEILLNISQTKNQSILNKICDQNFITDLLMLYEKYSSNNILHNLLTKLVQNLLSHFFERIDQKMCENQLSSFLEILYKIYYGRHISSQKPVLFKGSIDQLILFLYDKMLSIQIVFENPFWDRLRQDYGNQLFQSREDRLVFENSSVSNVSNSSHVMNEEEDDFQFDNTKMNQILIKQ